MVAARRWRFDVELEDVRRLRLSLSRLLKRVEVLESARAGDTSRLFRQPRHPRAPALSSPSPESRAYWRPCRRPGGRATGAGPPGAGRPRGVASPFPKVSMEEILNRRAALRRLAPPPPTPPRRPRGPWCLRGRCGRYGGRVHRRWSCRGRETRCWT
eukprot:tig00021293_g20012.t1